MGEEKLIVRRIKCMKLFSIKEQKYQSLYNIAIFQIEQGISVRCRKILWILFMRRFIDGT